MKQKGFTLLELIIVIVIVSLTTILITVKVEKNIRDAKKLKETEEISLIENAAYLYATTYQEELTTLNANNVQNIQINNLITKGLLNYNAIEDISVENYVTLAIIDNDIRVKYNKNQSYTNTIFLIGLDKIKISLGDTYEEKGAYVATPSGVISLTSENINSTVNINQKGQYKVTYNYQNSESVERIIIVE